MLHIFMKITLWWQYLPTVWDEPSIGNM